ncbi:MAG: DUF2156 domain-containing protein [Anaerolineae bacterium]|nr:DUF2156 domain-containing protein [Anaerolineae bacterium]
MITSAERAHILARAYVPEHLPHYVTAISQTEPFLIGDFVAHVRGNAQLIFVGYPLDENFDAVRMLDALERARTRFKPSIVSILAPALPDALRDCTPLPPDEYYRLDVTTLVIPQKTRNMLTRARREVTIREGKFGKEHQRLVEEFLRAHHLDDATRAIFQRVHEYAKCPTVCVIEARNARGNLVAFDMADFGAAQYAFYMFNFRATQSNIPGASDLLLAHIIERARAEGKRYVNLGLGIDAGVTFFKRKWGAVPFLKHCACVQQSSRADAWLGLFEQLQRV